LKEKYLIRYLLKVSFNVEFVWNEDVLSWIPEKHSIPIVEVFKKSKEAGTYVAEAVSDSWDEAEWDDLTIQLVDKSLIVEEATEDE